MIRTGAELRNLCNDFIIILNSLPSKSSRTLTNLNYEDSIHALIAALLKNNNGLAFVLSQNEPIKQRQFCSILGVSHQFKKTFTIAIVQPGMTFPAEASWPK